MVHELFESFANANLSPSRPHVTLSYAQSVDGSIATHAKAPLPLSNAQSLQLTHRIRASHDAILIGIGTMLSDNPRLTVRGLQGEHPQPIILDSQLRTPPEARIFQHPKRPWFAVSDTLELDHRSGSNGRLIPLPPGEGGLDLEHLLGLLHARDIRRLMVEGGSQVISSFLRLRLVDVLAITISPQFVGGLPSLERLEGGSYPRLHQPRWFQMEGDLILWGTPDWGSE